MYSSVSYDACNNFYVEGGGTPLLNMSANLPIPASSSVNGSWKLFNSNSSWSLPTQQSIEPGYVPLYSLHAQAPELNLVFHLNGMLNNGLIEQVYPKMTIVDTRTNRIRTVSTESISPSAARVGAVFQYLPHLGRKGALILFGGAERHENDIINDPWRTMVNSTYALTSVTLLIPGNLGWTRYCTYL
jgi:hypothetical protein